MKEFLKKVIGLLSFVIVIPLVLCCKISGEGFFIACGQMLALIPGKIGSYVRVAFYQHTLADCHSAIFIGFGTYFSHSEAVVNDGVYIGAYCIIGKSVLEKDVTIGSGVHLLSGKRQHGYKTVGKPIQEQKGVFQTIVIGQNSWIGSGAIVMVDIGEQNVVAAGSVVVSETTKKDRVILAGNPATVLRSIA